MDFSNYVYDNMYYVVNWHYTIDLMVGMFLRKGLSKGLWSNTIDTYIAMDFKLCTYGIFINYMYYVTK